MSSSKNLEFKKTAFLSKSNSTFIEEMYMKFIKNDPNLPNSWKEYFSEIADEADIVIKEINRFLDEYIREVEYSLSSRENAFVYGKLLNQGRGIISTWKGDYKIRKTRV